MGVFFYVLGHIWGNICALENKKPTTTRVIGYIVETAGRLKPLYTGSSTNMLTN